jgi:hypothetical protein
LILFPSIILIERFGGGNVFSMGFVCTMMNARVAPMAATARMIVRTDSRIAFLPDHLRK